MSQTNGTNEPVVSKKLFEEQAPACGPGCGCHATGASGWSRWVVGAVVILTAGVLVVRAVTKTDDTATQASAAAFAEPQGAVAAAAVEMGAAVSAPDADAVATTDEALGAAPAAATTVPEPKLVVCGEPIGSLGDLNTKAMDKDGVFVFLAGKDAAKARAAATVVEKTADTIRERGIDMALFTIADGSREYANLAKQVPPPGVIAMVKGRGASAVSGDDITESKLMQAFVAASSGGGGGGCGPSGCGPVGCR